MNLYIIYFGDFGFSFYFWRRQSGIAIVYCSYKFCYSTETTVTMFTSNIRGKLFTYISHVVIYI